MELEFKAWLGEQDQFRLYQTQGAATFFLVVRDAFEHETKIAENITAGQLSNLWDTLAAVPALALHVQQFIEQKAQE